MLSNQEIFNKVYVHLLAQGRKSEEKDAGSCAYRSPEGLSCAVGCLIQDEFYSLGFEGLSIAAATCTDPDSKDKALLKALTDSGIDVILSRKLLCELQDIHDNSSPELWRTHLEGLAQELGLTVPEMPTRTE
jgi:hypothetical protein